MNGAEVPRRRNVRPPYHARRTTCLAPQIAAISGHAKPPTWVLAFVCTFVLLPWMWTSCLADQLTVFHDATFVTGSDSNAVFILIENSAPRQAVQLTLQYDSSILTLKNVRSAGRAVPDIETTYSDNGDARARIIVMDVEAGRTSIPAGTDQIVDLTFALVWNAQPGTQTSLSITSAAVITNTLPAALVDSLTWNQVAVDIVTAVPDDPQAVPRRNALYQNAPNPFNPVTKIRFEVARRERVRVQVYDLRGRLVSRLFDQYLEPGMHTVSWNGRDDSDRQLASGVYFYRLDVGDFSSVKKMTLLK